MSEEHGAHAQFHIGSPASDHVSVRALGRTHPTAGDHWDGNWIPCRIAVRSQPFSGEFPGDLRTDEVAGLRDDLERLRTRLDGEASFTTLDGHLAFDVRGDGLGHFTVAGEARADPGSGTALVFALEFDQTLIPAVLAISMGSWRRFPSRGAWRPAIVSVNGDDAVR